MIISSSSSSSMVINICLSIITTLDVLPARRRSRPSARDESRTRACHMAVCQTIIPIIIISSSIIIISSSSSSYSSSSSSSTSIISMFINNNYMYII